MRPTILFVGGALLIWIVANGKARAVWQALFSPTVSQTPGRPSDPSGPQPPPLPWEPKPPQPPKPWP